MKPLTKEEKDLRRLADCLPPENVKKLRDFARMLKDALALEQEKDESNKNGAK